VNEPQFSEIFQFLWKITSAKTMQEGKQASISFKREQRGPSFEMKKIQISQKAEQKRNYFPSFCENV
jgi:hypothetical protein